MGWEPACTPRPDSKSPFRSNNRPRTSTVVNIFRDMRDVMSAGFNETKEPKRDQSGLSWSNLSFTIFLPVFRRYRSGVWHFLARTDYLPRQWKNYDLLSFGLHIIWKISSSHSVNCIQFLVYSSCERKISQHPIQRLRIRVVNDVELTIWNCYQTRQVSSKTSLFQERQFWYAIGDQTAKWIVLD